MSKFTSNQTCPVCGKRLTCEVDRLDGHIVMYERNSCECGFEYGTETGAYWGIINGVCYEWSYNEANSPNEMNFYRAVRIALEAVRSRPVQP